MNGKALIERLDLFADFPENIPLIRRYIVHLAIRGDINVKSADQPTPEEMLQRIALQATGLNVQGSPRKQKPLPPLKPDELPAAYAEQCTFNRLGNIATLIKGRTGIQASKPGPYPLVVTAAERSSCDHYDFDGAAAIIPMVSSTGHGHASLNRLHFQDGKFALGTILCAVFPVDETLISARFLFAYLTAFKEDLLVARMIGTANVTLTVAKIAEVPVPILPPAVQERVAELMTVCDQLEAAQQERELRQDGLAASVLQRLNRPVEADSPEIRREHARFFLQQISHLTSSPKHIRALRKSILTLAVGGRLVQQDAHDESVSALLERVLSDIDRYRVENGAPSASIEPVKSEPMPFSLPVGWIWTRLASVCRVITDGDHLPPPKSDDGVAFLTIGNISSGQLDFSNCRYVPRDYFEKIATYRRPEIGDLLYTVVGASYGRPVLVDTTTEFCVQRHIAIMKPALGMSARYMHLLMKSPFVYAQATSCLTGTAQPTVPLRPLRNFLVPLPPLEEQDRIVAKVDELMTMCDQLETLIATARKDSQQLLESLLGTEIVGSRISAEPKSRRIQPNSGQEHKRSGYHMTSNSATSVESLIACIDDIGGTATPERLLKHAGLSDDIETFYDLLRAARNSGALIIPLGPDEVIQRTGNAH